MYRIETQRDGKWTDEGLEAVPESNIFESRREAEQAIESLQALGDEWATAEYRVAKIRQECYRCGGDHTQQEHDEIAAVVQPLADYANHSGDPEAFATVLTGGTHRTLQQGIMRMFLACIEKWGTTKHYDARNEATVMLSRKILQATGDRYDRHLPLI